MSREQDIPLLDFPGEEAGIIEASKLMARRPRVPGACVLCFFLDLLKERAAAGEMAPIETLRGEGEPVVVYRHGQGADAVTVAFGGLGGPFAAAVLEELIGLGARRFFCCGGAGALDGALPPGRLIIPDEAVRDEGTSYHYLPAGAPARPDPRAVEILIQEARARGLEFERGRTWTTDAVYRETRARIARRRAEGCLTVEMEAASLFAAARFRSVPLAQALYAGDDVSGERWRHRGWNQLGQVRSDLLDLCLAAARRPGAE